MISTTIKKIYMDKILSGEKKVEYKECTEYWNKRIITRKAYLEILAGHSMIKEHKVINFLCGRDSYKFKIEGIAIYQVPYNFEKMIKGIFCYHIHLGERVGGD